MTPEERKGYQEYLADFDPSPIGNGEDYIYPLSADEWLEQELNNTAERIRELFSNLLFKQRTTHDSPTD